MLASKAFGPPRGGPRRPITRLPVGKIRGTVVGFPCKRTIFGDVEMSLVIASCFPNASQQSIWASQGGGAAERDLTAIRGVVPRRTCGYSPGRDQNPAPLQFSFKTLMLSKY